uniref:DRBM domain-containing protein n=1 Tax=Rhodosorus marinus TaxID=101924 RepID=A0A7S0BL42_9RHOD|mmetsp:Transcript_21421/g.31190  ORF Transcript_21421/g.31190 Transcript_21421/m.31190 type:complete len:798 (+) Transcript_21421:179-2572(+)
MDVLQRYSPGKQDSHCVSILNEFCQKLRFSQLPEYSFGQESPYFFCRISLPPEAGISNVFEGKDFTKKSAKAKAAVQAVLYLRAKYTSAALGPVPVQRGPVMSSAEPAKVEPSTIGGQMQPFRSFDSAVPAVPVGSAVGPSPRIAGAIAPVGLPGPSMPPTPVASSTPSGSSLPSIPVKSEPVAAGYHPTYSLEKTQKEHQQALQSLTNPVLERQALGESSSSVIRTPTSTERVETKQSKEPSVMYASNDMGGELLLKDLRNVRKETGLLVNVLIQLFEDPEDQNGGGDRMCIVFDTARGRSVNLVMLSKLSALTVQVLIQFLNYSARVCGYDMTRAVAFLHSKYKVVLQSWCDARFVSQFRPGEFNAMGKLASLLEDRAGSFDESWNSVCERAAEAFADGVEMLDLYSELIVAYENPMLGRLTGEKMSSFSEQIAFAQTHPNTYAMVSYPVIFWRDDDNDIDCVRVEVEETFQGLSDILPESLKAVFNEISQLTDIILAVGKKPSVLAGGMKLSLDHDNITTQDITQIINSEDKRMKGTQSGTPGKLSRLSVIRNKGYVPYSITIRNACLVRGISTVILDLISSKKSILIVAKHAGGKTTFLRDLVRQTSKSACENVCVIDSENELGGDSIYTHSFLGDVIRFMGGCRNKQIDVVEDSLINHNPTIVAVDNLIAADARRACRMTKDHGAKLFATMHGTIESVLRGDNAPAAPFSHPKRRRIADEVRDATQGVAAAVFDAIVELNYPSTSGNYSVSIVHSPASAVQEFDSGKPYQVEVRTIQKEEKLYSSRTTSNRL